MYRDEVVRALAAGLPNDLATDLTDNFLTLRQDATTGTLGRAAPGKFVETAVQALQFLHAGKYDPNPDVDGFLRKIESQASPLDDGLRICASRMARSMYSLRSKRNILHKGSVDPNAYDLRYLYFASQWMMAEMVRTISGLPMGEAGKLIEGIQAPLGLVVEDFGDRKLVLRDMSTRDEVLAILHSHYPERVATSAITASVDRRAAKTVRNTVRRLWTERLVDGDQHKGYKMTASGFNAAVEVICSHAA